jgi:F-type H+/Na+-transporting ATPase subunit alpha
VELLKQPQYRPYSMEREVVSVWAGTSGNLDDVPVEDIRRFDTEFLDYLGREEAAIMQSIATTGDLSDGDIAELTSAIGTYKKQFRTTEGHLLGHEAEVAALDEAEIEHAQITRKVRKG